MTEEAKKRLESSRENHPRLNDIPDLDERAAWWCGFDDGYKAGLNDPEANRDVITERESVINFHLSRIKKLEEEIEICLLKNAQQAQLIKDSDNTSNKYFDLANSRLAQISKLTAIIKLVESYIIDSWDVFIVAEKDTKDREKWILHLTNSIGYVREHIEQYYEPRK